MQQAWLYGLATAAPLALGSILAARLKLPRPVIAVIMAFAAGTFISALAFDLFAEAFRQGGVAATSAGFMVGATGYILLNKLVAAKVSKRGQRGGALLLAGAGIDGIPENVALGTTLAAGAGSAPLLLAIAVSNFPEAFVSAEELRSGGESNRRVVLTWLAVAAGLVAFVPLGATIGDSSETALAVIQSFAAGAVLGLVADSMLPQAYEEGGRWVAMATAAGFLLSFMLNEA